MCLLLIHQESKSLVRNKRFDPFQETILWFFDFRSFSPSLRQNQMNWERERERVQFDLVSEPNQSSSVSSGLWFKRSTAGHQSPEPSLPSSRHHPHPPSRLPFNLESGHVTVPRANYGHTRKRRRFGVSELKTQRSTSTSLEGRGERKPLYIVLIG